MSIAGQRKGFCRTHGVWEVLSQDYNALHVTIWPGDNGSRHEFRRWAARTLHIGKGVGQSSKTRSCDSSDEQLASRRALCFRDSEGGFEGGCMSYRALHASSTRQGARKGIGRGAGARMSMYINGK